MRVAGQDQVGDRQASQAPERGEGLHGVTPVPRRQVGRVRAQRHVGLARGLILAAERHDDIPAEQGAEAPAFHQVADAPRRVARRGDRLDAHPSDLERLAAAKLHIHGGRVRRVVGHVERAEERLARTAGPDHRRVARPGVDPRPGRRAQRLGPADVVAVRVGQEDVPHALPIEPQLGHLRLEPPRVAIQARIDQDQPVRGLDDVGHRGGQSPEHVDPGAKVIARGSSRVAPPSPTPRPRRA